MESSFFELMKRSRHRPAIIARDSGNVACLQEVVIIPYEYAAYHAPFSNKAPPLRSRHWLRLDSRWPGRSNFSLHDAATDFQDNIESCIAQLLRNFGYGLSVHCLLLRADTLQLLD
jgi:hypothetical protein